MTETNDGTPRRILIAGCGYVGSALGEQLLQRGYEVWGLRRDPSRLPAGIQPIVADLGDPATLSALPGPFNRVFYTAGANAFSDSAYKRAYVDGLRNTLAAVEGSGGAGRVVFTSSTAVYAQDDGGWVDESSPTDPTSFSGQRVLEGERLLQSTHKDGVVLRLGGIYGPGRTGLIDRVRKGEARRDPADTHYLNLIHRDDIVGALLHVAAMDAPAPTYIGVDNEPQNYNALLEWIAEELGVPVPPVSDAPQTRGRPVRNRRCSNKRLAASGFRFRYPDARHGYRELLQEATDRR